MFGSRMASPSKEKSPCLGVRVGLVPLYLCKGAPSLLLLSVFLVVSWFDLGNISSGRLGELISFLGCPPVQGSRPSGLQGLGLRG